MKLTKKLSTLAIPLYLLVCDVAYSQAFSRATSKTQALTQELRTLAPIIGTLALIVIGIAYSKRLASNVTLMRWAVGALLVGSSGEIANFFFG
jgi:TrbC/VIRB2 pilin